MTGHPRRSTVVAVLVVVLMVPLTLGQFGTCTNDVPSLELTSMNPSGRIDPGAVVQLNYIAQDRDNNADITFFYDADGVANTGDEILIAMVKEDGAEFGATYNWLTVGVPPLTYHVGASIRDPLHASITRYYTTTITIPGAAMSQFDLTQIGVSYDGSIWQGFNFSAQAGFALSECLDVGRPGNPDALEDTSPDGIPEFLITARFGEPFSRGNVGEVYLVLGSGARFNGTFELNDVGTDIPGAVYAAPYAYGGITEGITSVTAVRDLDGDGRAEVMLGMPFVEFLSEDLDPDPCDQDDPGVYSDGILPNACTSTPGQSPGDHDILGIISTGMMVAFPGSSIFRLGGGFVCDIAAAGQDLGQPTDNPFTYSVGARLRRLTPGPVLGYPCEPFDQFGRYAWTLDRMQDFTADGVEDWVISEPRRDGDIGGVQVIRGQTLWDPAGLNLFEPIINNHAGFIEGEFSYPQVQCIGNTADPCIRMCLTPFYVQIDGETPGDMLGDGHGIGDFNSDGPPDVTCGAPSADPGGIGDAGITYVVYGRLPFGNINVGDIDDPDPLVAVPGLELEGTNMGDRFGTTQDSAGDFNGDGVPDWVLGAPGRDALGRFDNGMVAVVFGDPFLLGSYNADQLATPDLPAVVIYGANSNDFFGTMVAPGGDINGDGFDDILVSAPGFDSLARVDSGAVYVIFGGPAISGAIDARLLATDALPGRIYYGPRAGEMIGTVAAAGDIDDDGFGDILIGNPNADPDGRINAGEAYLIYGFRR